MGNSRKGNYLKVMKTNTETFYRVTYTVWPCRAIYTADFPKDHEESEFRDLYSMQYPNHRIEKIEVLEYPRT